MDAVAIRLLGPMEVAVSGSPVAAGGPAQRAVLAMLALQAGEPISADSLLEGLWGETDEPATGTKSIQIHISRLRRALGASGSPCLLTVPGGYRLDRAALSIDAGEFERLLAMGREELAAGSAEKSAAILTQALALWRGPALMDVRDFPFAGLSADRYDELRIDATEELNEACLAMGESEELLPRLHALVGEHPYRERLHAQLMLALYRSGQQAAALEAYQAARSRLTLDLGVEPGPELQRLQRQILEQAPELEADPTARGHWRGLARPASGFGLPPPPFLVGRDELLKALQRLSNEERLITLTGPGGSGKTALGIVLLHRLVPRFAGGAAFVDLAAITRPEQVVPAIAAAVGLAQNAPRLPQQLAAMLGGRRMVVLLDNLEHLLGAVEDVAPLVDATCGLFIATSRTPLALKAEHLLEVPPLPVPPSDGSDLADQPAVQLFLRAASAAGGEIPRTGPLLEAIAQICRAVDGLPLAIEIVAAQARVQAIPELAEHLMDRLPRLRREAQDIPARHRTMEAAIHWSVDRLAHESRGAFSALAVFAGSFDVGAAAAVLGRDRAAAMDLVSSLVTASLLTRQPSAAGQARFRMLEPMRAVARELADPAQRQRAVHRHTEFFVAVVNALCPESTGIRRPEDLARLRAEHPNLMAALWNLAETEPDRCVDTVVQLQDYWLWTGGELAAKQVIEAVLLDDQLSEWAVCEALTLEARFGVRLGLVAEGAIALGRALAMAPRLPDATHARAQIAAAWNAFFVTSDADRDRGRRAAHAAVALARRAGERLLLAHALATSAKHEALGTPEADADDVKAWLEEGLGIARGDGMAVAEGWLLSALSTVHAVYDHDPEQAYEASRAAFDMARRFESPALAAMHAVDVSAFALRAGLVDEGRATALSALQADVRAGHRLVGLYQLNNLALAEAADGRWHNLLVLYAAVRSVADQMGATSFFMSNPQDEALQRDAVAHLGESAAADATAIGRRMDYQEAVHFAFGINQITPPD